MSNTIESIEQGNKLIADFMGIPVYERETGTLFTDHGTDDLDCVEGIAYHCSWDWLMPVVYKIIGIEKTFHKGSGVSFVLGQCKKYNNESEFLEAVYNAVIQFIEWYNNQKSNQ